MKKAVLMLLGGVPLLALGAAAAPPGGLPVVTDGRAAAVVVTAEKPTAVARYAAKELVEHVERGTGARLAVVAESAVPKDAGARIYVGDSAAARAAGIDTRRLAPEECLLQTHDRSLFIVGDDGGGDPLVPDTRAGTLFGVYEWLERDLGARWLWPGELGTVVPRTKTVTALPIDRSVVPPFFQRRLRPGLSFELQHPALGFTPKAAEAYAKEQTVFLRRHRMGRGQRMSYGHAFTDWWEKYGAQHPEWFQQLADGRRGPAKKGGRYSMCVSNPEFQREIVARWKERGGGVPGKGSPFINAVENDILGLCQCAVCRSWDGPQPADYFQFVSPKSKLVGSQFVSDRYARFWLQVQQLAAREDPDATVIGYVYFNYFHAPTPGTRLNPNVLLGYCPSGGWYPRAPDEHEWYKAQWRGWRQTGARLFSRTNYFLDGYCMPFIFAHQFADDFQHAARNGMVATDFDSLTGQWSTQGPNLYLLARLHVRPEAKPDDLLAEYYGGFGPAAKAVKAYFDYWEGYTMGHREATNRAFEQLEASRWRTWARAAHVAFPPDCFPPAKALLAKAEKAAAGDRQAAARVEFLRKGLTHAQLCVRAAAALSLANPDATPEKGKKALDELLAFRRKTERDGIANFTQLGWVEDLSWKLSNETRQSPELYP